MRIVTVYRMDIYGKGERRPSGWRREASRSDIVFCGHQRLVSCNKVVADLVEYSAVAKGSSPPHLPPRDGLTVLPMGRYGQLRFAHGPGLVDVLRS
jgi:hypothetical protein